MRNFVFSIIIIFKSLLAYLSIVAIHEGFLREEYEAKAAEITLKANAQLATQNIDSVAHWAVKARNDLKVEIREKGNPITQRLAEQRNLKKYGNKIGPSYQMLEKELSKKGIDKANISKEIIASAGRANQQVSNTARNIKLFGIGFLLAYWLNVFFIVKKMPLTLRKTAFLKELLTFFIGIAGSTLAVWLCSPIDVLIDSEIDTYLLCLLGMVILCVPLARIGTNFLKI